LATPGFCDCLTGIVIVVLVVMFFISATLKNLCLLTYTHTQTQGQSVQKIA